MKPIVLFLVLLVVAASAQMPPPPAATPSEVVAGTDNYKRITPYGLSQSGVLGGGGVVSNTTAIGATDTLYTNATDYFLESKFRIVYTSTTGYLQSSVSNANATVYFNYDFIIPTSGGASASNTITFVVPPRGHYRVRSLGGFSGLAGNGQVLTYFSTNRLTVTTNAANIVTTNVIYLASRTDGSSGNGTISDPYSAGTPDLLNTVWNAYIQPIRTNTTVVFLPGRYWATNGLTHSAQKTNVTFLGYGATINLTNSSLPNSGAVFGLDGSTNMTVAGFTFDLSRSAFSVTGVDKVFAGITAGGFNNTFQDLTVRGVMSEGLTTESFAILVWGTNVTVRNCRIVDQNGPYASGIAVVGDQFQILNNYISLTNDLSNANPYGFSLSLYCSDSIVSGNVINGGDTGIHMDNPGGSYQNFSGVAVIGNVFDCLTPVRIQPTTATYSNWVFSGNVFKSNFEWFQVNVSGSGIISNIVFTGNVFAGNPSQTPNLSIAGTSNLVFTANHFQSQPSLNSGYSFYGVGNTVGGLPNDRIFTQQGLTPFGHMAIWQGAVPVDTTTGNRVTNYTRVIARGGVTCNQATGVITTPMQGYYRLELTYLPTVAGGSYEGVIYTNGVSTGIRAKNYSDPNLRAATGIGIEYLPSGATVDVRSSVSGNTIDASLSVTLIR